MIKYYIYSKPNCQEKYTEVTEEQFIAEVINAENRFYISFGDVLLECSYEQFKSDKAEKDRARYISQLSTGVYPSFFSFDENFDMFADMTDKDDDSVQEEAAILSFWSYVSTLSEEKQRILMLYYKAGYSQTEIAKRVGKSQQYISKVCLTEIYKFNKNRKS